MLRYASQTLCIIDKATDTMDNDALAAWLRDKFNRPIRVCGVVPNEGEPGGGPYLAYNADGSASPQILESAQINPDDPAAVEMMKGGTHFNPVDLVCYIKDYKGIKFDLRKFVDVETGLTCLHLLIRPQVSSAARVTRAVNSKPWNCPACGTAP